MSNTSLDTTTLSDQNSPFSLALAALCEHLSPMAIGALYELCKMNAQEFTGADDPDYGAFVKAFERGLSKNCGLPTYQEEFQTHCIKIAEQIR